MSATKQSFLGFARHALTTAGGGLIASGYVAQDDWTAIVGGLVAAVGVVWSVAEKYISKKE